MTGSLARVAVWFGSGLLAASLGGCACLNFADYGPQCCSACGQVCTEACIPICIDSIRGEGPLNVVRARPEDEPPAVVPAAADRPRAVAY